MVSVCVCVCVGVRVSTITMCFMRFIGSRTVVNVRKGCSGAVCLLNCAPLLYRNRVIVESDNWAPTKCGKYGRGKMKKTIECQGNLSGV